MQDFALCRLKEAHLASFVSSVNNPEILRWMRDAMPSPFTEEDARQLIEQVRLCDDSREIYRVIVVDEQAVGCICVCAGKDIYRRSAEIGYWLAQPYWGNHIMTRAVEQMCRLAFERLDIVRIYAEPFADNIASRTVLSNAGFTLEGIMRQGVVKDGITHDYCMYALVKGELE